MVDKLTVSRTSPSGKGAPSENYMTRKPGSNIVRLSMGDWLVLVGIIVPIAVTILMTTINRQREIAVQIETVLVQQEATDQRVARVEQTLDTLLLYYTGFTR